MPFGEAAHSNSVLFQSGWLALSGPKKHPGGCLLPQPLHFGCFSCWFVGAPCPSVTSSASPSSASLSAGMPFKGLPLDVLLVAFSSVAAAESVPLVGDLFRPLAPGEAAGAVGAVPGRLQYCEAWARIVSLMCFPTCIDVIGSFHSELHGSFHSELLGSFALRAPWLVSLRAP